MRRFIPGVRDLYTVQVPRFWGITPPRVLHDSPGRLVLLFKRWDRLPWLVQRHRRRATERQQGGWAFFFSLYPFTLGIFLADEGQS